MPTHLRIFLLAIVTFCGLHLSQAQTESTLEKFIQRDKVAFKLKRGFTDATASQLAQLGASAVAERVFPHHKTLPLADEQRGLIDLSRTYQIEGLDEAKSAGVIVFLQSRPEVLWAEYRSVEYTSFTPTDSLFSRQYALQKVQAQLAWDITQGDTSIVVGIVDSGVQTDHPDLAPNQYTNFLEPIDGIDNDSNGYVDDRHGWDMCGPTFQGGARPDNNPTITMGGTVSHGTHVAGIATGGYDNREGIAGLGGRARWMGIKCSYDNLNSSRIYFGYEAMVYAADAGCRIINNSWGGDFRTDLNAEAVAYAVRNTRALVIAAAGNTSGNGLHYPSGFPGVLSVTSTDSRDQLSSFTTYGYQTLIAAPGTDILSTYWRSAYRAISGTSMATPMVAGAAALVAAQYPNLSAEQIKLRLMRGVDNIDTIGNNMGRQFAYGSGRLNAYKALLYDGPGIKCTRTQAVFGPGSAGAIGDTVQIYLAFTTVLTPTAPGTIARLTSLDSSVEVLNPDIILGSLAVGDTLRIGTPVRVVVRPTADFDTDSWLRIAYVIGGNERESENFSLRLNSSVVDFEHYNLSGSIASNGRLGTADGKRTIGKGLQLKGAPRDFFKSIMTEFAIGAGYSQTFQVNQIRSQLFQGINNTDFRPLQPVKVSRNTADYKVFEGTYNDAGGNGRLRLEVRHRSWFFNDPADSSYFLHELTFTNRRTSPYANFYTGAFVDFDIDSIGFQDNIEVDTLQRSIRTRGPQAGVVAGVAHLSNGPFIYHVVGTRQDSATRLINLSDGIFTPAEKWQALSRRSTVTSLANAGSVASMVSSGPVTVAPQDSVRFVVALIAARTDASFDAAVARAKLRYGQYLVANRKAHSGNAFGLYPNPAQTQLTFSGIKPGQAVHVFDVQGRMVLSTNTKYMRVEFLPKGIYTAVSGGVSLRFVKE